VKTWVRLVLYSIAFWAVWVGIAGLAMVVHGDCGVGATVPETAACVREKGWVGLAVMLVGAVVYGVAAWKFAKRPHNGGGRNNS
jgi:succinate dehydrogenase hydrophobic anchor subunit